MLEAALSQLADVIGGGRQEHRDVPGAGAAGGMGFGLISFVSLRYGWASRSSPRARSGGGGAPS